MVWQQSCLGPIIDGLPVNLLPLAALVQSTTQTIMRAWLAGRKGSSGEAKDPLDAETRASLVKSSVGDAYLCHEPSPGSEHLHQ